MCKFLIFFHFVVIVFIFFEKSKCDKNHLPDDVEPRSYDLKITPDFNTFTFSGQVDIIIHFKFSTNVIQLHCRNLKLKKTLTWAKGSHIGEHVDLALIQKDDLCVFTSPQTFKQNSDHILRIEYEGELKEDTKGLYRSSYRVNGKKKWFLATNFYGTYAREAFPCFDEPRYRTPFKLSVARYGNQKVISNMPLEGSNSHSDGNHIWDKFKISPPIPTHLVAIVVFEYTSISLSDYANHLMEVWTRPNIISNAQFALRQSHKVLTQLENFIGVPRELSKLDIVALKTHYSLTDNWGLSVLGEDFLIVHEKTAPHMQKVITTAAMCHLFARHWFGEQITPIAWDYSWLTEAFAGYFEFFITHLVEPEWKIDVVFNIEVLQSALWNEMANPGALTRSVVLESQINNKYGSINYCKGASILRMLEHIISKWSLRSALRKYLMDSKTSRNGLVKPDDFFQALRYQSDINSFPLPPHITIIDVMKSWTENIGHPVINVIRNYETSSVELQQKTYKSILSSLSPLDQEWITPVSYTTKTKATFSNTEPTEWIIGDKNTAISMKVENSDWIICNLQRTGYYRVNYDARNWNFLTKQLEEDMEKIHLLNRAQLIDDSFTFAFDGILPYSVPLKLGRYLVNETEMVPLLSAIFHFEILYGKYEDTASRMFFCMYIKKILDKKIQSIGFDIKSEDDSLTKIGKPKLLLLACKIGLESCLRQALTEYNSNIYDLRKVQPDLKEVVYCAALKAHPDEENAYKNLWATYHTSEIAYDKITILKTMGCSQNESLLKNTLSKLLDTKDTDIDEMYEKYAYNSILSSSRGVTATLKFLQEQITKISQFNTDQLTTLETILTHLEPKVQSIEHFRMLKTIKQDLENSDPTKYEEFLSTVKRILSSGIKRAQENNQISDTLRPVFHEILNIPSPVPPPPPAKQSNAFTPASSLFLCIICSIFTIIR